MRATPIVIGRHPIVIASEAKQSQGQNKCPLQRNLILMAEAFRESFDRFYMRLRRFARNDNGQLVTMNNCDHLQLKTLCTLQRLFRIVLQTLCSVFKVKEILQF
jgi:hypothetical protein